MPDSLLRPRSRARIAADNRAELEGWIDERVAELRTQGVSVDEAHRRALAEFGDMDGARDYAGRQDLAVERRATVSLWLQDLSSDLHICLRSLARTPVVMAVLLATFALGIG